jgi:tetratricopeptide (TPR) repeat protein
LQQLLKAPLGMKLQLSDLGSDANEAPAAGINSVQALFDAKKYDEAAASFSSLPDTVKASFDAQLLLCKINEDRKAYKDAIRACDLAVQAKPDNSEPYGLEALSLLMLGDTQHAELMASKAADLSSEIYYKQLLGIIHYSEEKYGAISRDFPGESNDTLVLSMQAGAAFHNKDYQSFRRIATKINVLKPSNGWRDFVNGSAAERELNWDRAVEEYGKCSDDADMIDPICSISVMRVKIRQVNYGAAKTDLDKLLADYPTNHNVLSEGIFLEVLIENPTEADRLHDVLKSSETGSDNFTECLYYYARSQ